MIRRSLRHGTLAALVLSLAAFAALPAQAQKYRYGRYTAAPSRSSQNQFQGFFVYLDAIGANPRNTDIVLATVQSGGVEIPVIPSWSDELTGRLGFGYQWANGNRIEGRVAGGSFSTDTFNDGSQGALAFAIGPPVPGIGDVGSPGSLAIQTEINTTVADVLFGRTHELSERFALDWFFGLRYALYEETSGGTYAQLGGSSYVADKSNEGEMIGLRLGLRGDYRFAKKFSVATSIAWSYLDGELRSTSMLVPVGSSTPASFAALTDDSRSGSISEIELTFRYHLLQDALQIYAGWTQSVWRDIATDLVRNFPDQTVPLRDRYDVTFSGYLLGIGVRF